MQNNILLVSIITPTYNRKELLEKAILSVINQKKNIKFEWELLIIDDGSNDGTKEYIKKYLDKYKNNIKYFYQENSGVGKARNVGLNNISKNSDYTIFLDSDDELVTDCVYTCLDKWNDLQISGEYENIAGIMYFCKDEKGNLVGNQALLLGKEEAEFWYITYIKNSKISEMHSMVKSDIYHNKNFRFNENIVGESILWFQIIKYLYSKGKRFLIINYIGRIYNINSSSDKITKTISLKRFKNNAILNEKILEIIGDDLMKYKFINSYCDYLFRIGVNWILYGEKKKGLNFIKKSLKIRFNIIRLIIYFLSIINKKIVLFIYKLYI